MQERERGREGWRERESARTHARARARERERDACVGIGIADGAVWRERERERESARARASERDAVTDVAVCKERPDDVGGVAIAVMCGGVLSTHHLCVCLINLSLSEMMTVCVRAGIKFVPTCSRAHTHTRRTCL